MGIRTLDDFIMNPAEWPWGFSDAKIFTLIPSSFDHFDLSKSPDNFTSEVSRFQAELVAAFRDGAIAEESSKVEEITSYGQHKWPQNQSVVNCMWILAREGTTGDQLRIFAKRESENDPNTVITEAANWDFEALWKGSFYTGTGTWQFSSNMGGYDFSTNALSGDDGAWAFMDGANTQGDQNRPSGNLFGVGNWNDNDTEAEMSALNDDYADFQGIVIFGLV